MISSLVASPRLNGASAATNNLGKSQEDQGKKTESMTASMIKAELIIGGVKKIFESLKAVVTDSVKAFIEQEKADALLEARLKSTAGVAGMTSEQIKKIAVSLKEMSGIDDTVIQQAETLLLTFTNIGKNVFPEATQAILDMSVGLGIDLQNAAMQVGKALNDPAEGLSMLRRVGIQFTNDQEALIKSLATTGRTMEAQKIILSELEVKFAGAAAAARDTFGGSLQALDTNIDDVKEQFGGIIAIFGRDFVENANRAAKSAGDILSGLKDYLSSETESERVSKQLKKATDELVTSYGNYKTVVDELKTKKGELNGIEKTSLQVQQTTLRNEIIKQLQSISESYRKLYNDTGAVSSLQKQENERIQTLKNAYQLYGTVIKKYGTDSSTEYITTNKELGKTLQTIAEKLETLGVTMPTIAHKGLGDFNVSSVIDGFNNIGKELTKTEKSMAEMGANVAQAVNTIASAVASGAISMQDIASLPTGLLQKISEEMKVIKNKAAQEDKKRVKK